MLFLLFEKFREPDPTAQLRFTTRSELMHENIVQKTTSDTSNTRKHSLTPKPNEFV